MRIGIVVGERSGDILGAGLMRELISIDPEIIFEGILGPRMIEVGGEKWASAQELSVMGIVEPLKFLPKLLLLRKKILKRWQENPPDIFIGIDAPEFNLALESKLRREGITTVHYVSPSVWAWRKNRIRKIINCADKLLCILPFEPDLYKKYDFPAVYVGHPLADNLPYHLDRNVIRKEFNIDSRILIAVLPGSRISEVRRLGKYFVKAAKLLLKKYENISFIAPMASKDIYNQFEILLEQENIRRSFVLIEDNSHESMIASDLVLAASGTAVLESSLLNRPTIAVYKVSLISYIFLRTMIRIKHFTLPNILLKKEVVPELIQGDLSADKLSKVASNLLEDKDTQEIMKSNFKILRKKLSTNADRLAAKEILELFNNHK